VLGTAEIALILGLIQPSLLTGLLAGDPTIRMRAVFLLCAGTRIGAE